MDRDELLVRVDENDNVIGTVTDEKAHSTDEIYHREVGIIIFNSKDETLLQQRSFKKIHHPGRWTVACAGHVDAGEEPEHAVLRETQEELGIEIEPVYFDKFLDRVEGKESRFLWVYYAFYEGDDFEIEKEELECVRWVLLSDLDNFYNENDFSKLSYDFTKQIAKKVLN